MVLPALVAAVFLLAPQVSPTSQGLPSLADAWQPQADARCGPPCGEINPRVLFDFPDLPRDAMAMAVGETRTFDGTVTYWFDADDEGYTPPDPQEPIVISFSFPKLPAWARMTVEPTEIPVDTTCALCFNTSTEDPAAPQAHFEQTTPVTVILEIVAEPEPTPGYGYGKLQLFGKSTESGIYNPGYGIREFRIAAGEPVEETGFAAPGPSALLLVAAFGVVAALVARRR